MAFEDGFDEWWKSWPPHRRVGKPQCLKKWIKNRWAESAALIHSHVAWVKTQSPWTDGFIPLSTTYLNQQRWLDFEPPPEIPKPPDPVQVLREHKGAPMPADVRAKLKELRASI